MTGEITISSITKYHIVEKSPQNVREEGSQDESSPLFWHTFILTLTDTLTMDELHKLTLTGVAPTHSTKEEWAASSMQQRKHKVLGTSSRHIQIRYLVLSGCLNVLAGCLTVLSGCLTVLFGCFPVLSAYLTVLSLSALLALSASLFSSRWAEDEDQYLATRLTETDRRLRNNEERLDDVCGMITERFAAVRDSMQSSSTTPGKDVESRQYVEKRMREISEQASIAVVRAQGSMSLQPSAAQPALLPPLPACTLPQLSP